MTAAPTFLPAVLAAVAAAGPTVAAAAANAAASTPSPLEDLTVITNPPTIAAGPPGLRAIIFDLVAQQAEERGRAAHGEARWEA